MDAEKIELLEAVLNDANVLAEKIQTDHGIMNFVWLYVMIPGVLEMLEEDEKMREVFRGMVAAGVAGMKKYLQDERWKMLGDH